jgi:hypothetical protein
MFRVQGQFHRLTIDIEITSHGVVVAHIRHARPCPCHVLAARQNA